MSGLRAVPEKRRPERSAAGPTPAGFVLGLDVGSSVIRCHVYDHATLIRGSSAQKVESLYPQAGWVEIDPDALWLQFVTVIKESVRVAGIEMNQIVGLGISTQRATFITWNKKTGNHFHNFISWQDLRAVELVKSWNNSLIMKLLQNSCRVLHFFTRNKRFLAVSLFNFTNQHVSLRLAWILQNLVEVQKAVEEDNCCFGTLDTWLLHKLTKGSEFATDFSNASATGLFDPYKMHWSGLLASLLSIPLSILPPVKDTSHNFGSVDEEIFGVPIPIVAMIWSQAATRSKVNFQQHLGTTRNMGMVPHELFEFMCFSLFLRAVAETARWLCPELAVLPGAQLSWQKSLPRAKSLAFQIQFPWNYWKTPARFHKSWQW